MSKNQLGLNYNISIALPQTHYAEIAIEVVNHNKSDLTFKMPVWTPGSYLVREFEKSVEQVEATADNKNIDVKRIDKSTWKLTNIKGKTVQFKYRIYAFEQSVRTSFIDEDQAFLHNTSVFMYVEELMNYSGILKLKFPDKWKNLSTTLHQNAEGDLLFENYDDLADSPIQAGNHEEFTFDVMGVEHKVALVGISNCNKAQFSTDLEKICKIMAEVIGEHPCKKYLFIVKNVETGGGGLEHANSCTVMIPRWNWTDKAKYRAFLGLCAHEYFHLWNVKRLRPAELGPFNYAAENYTEQLWVAEGITSYYDELSMLKMGWITRNEFLTGMADNISKLENRPGSRVQTLAQSSMEAWIKEYRPNENSINTSISYYSKGLITAFLLDALLVQKTGGTKGLDDLMKLMYNRYFRDKNRGFTASEFESAASEIAGTNLSSFFDRNVRSLKQPDYRGILNSVGLEVNSGESEVYKLGITTSQESGKNIVKEVLSASTAWFGGINVNDEIISINGVRINNDIDKVLEKLEKPKLITVVIIRAGLVREFTLNAIPYKTYNYTIVAKEENTLLNKWLGN